MRVLVTGAAGFLGRSVVTALASGSHEVRGLVRDAAQAPRVAARRGVPVNGSVLAPASLTAAVDGCDLVIHLAQSQSDSLDVRRRVRVDGARNLVAAMAKAGVRRLLVGSGYWVYADNPGRVSEG